MKQAYPLGELKGTFRIQRPRGKWPGGARRVAPVLLLVLLLPVLMIAGCASKLPAIYSFQGLHAQFVNQDSIPVQFPGKYKGHIFVLDAIYTHCTDVCPETTDNLRNLEDSLNTLGIKGVKFVTLTYDPNRDTPSALKKFGERQDVNFTNWDFLTGTKANIDSVLGRVKIKYSFQDSSYNKRGQLDYGVLHPDECLLVDGAGRVRGIYGGSDLHLPSIIRDIRTLE